MRKQQGLPAFILLLRLVQISQPVDLTIDNQLVIIANDCYTRISIGSKIPDANVSFTIEVSSISDCEDECSKKRIYCNAFTVGISTKGNGTCALSEKIPRPEELQSHPDYDVYIRSQRTPQCEPDRLYKIGSGTSKQRQNDTKPITGFGSGVLRPIMPYAFPSTRFAGNVERPPAIDTNRPSDYQGYFPSTDNERRISDIIRNRNPRPTQKNFLPSYSSLDEYDDVKAWMQTNEGKPFDGKPVFGERINFPKTIRPGDFDFSLRGPFYSHQYLSSPNVDVNLRNYESRPFSVFSRPIQILDSSAGLSKPEDKPPVEHDVWIAHDLKSNQFPNLSTDKSNYHEFTSLHRFGNFGGSSAFQSQRVTSSKLNGDRSVPYNYTDSFYPENFYGTFYSTVPKTSDTKFEDVPAFASDSKISEGFREFGKKTFEKANRK